MQANFPLLPPYSSLLHFILFNVYFVNTAYGLIL